MMYYKLKSSGKGFKLVGTVQKIGKQGDGYLYLTQEEIDRLSPEAIEGYQPQKKSFINTKYEMYRNLNKK